MWLLSITQGVVSHGVVDYFSFLGEGSNAHFIKANTLILTLMGNVIAYMMVLKNLNPYVKKWSFATLFVHLGGQMIIFLRRGGLNFLKPICSQLHYPYSGKVKMGC